MIRLTIEKRKVEGGGGRGLTARDYTFKINGVDITNGLRHIDLSMSADEVNDVHIRFIPDEIDVDADALAALIAQIPIAESAA